jgi:chitinase
LLPTHVISHAPQAPYFAGNHYKNGGYQTVHAKVGNLIDFYNIQFYNQEATTYDTY